MSRAVGIVQARMGSTRLPGKILKEFCGIPMLAFQIRRLKKARRLDALVIATTTDAKDDPVAELAAKEGVACIRGSEEDVLGRFLQAARAHKADIVVRLSGDNPLTDPEIVDSIIDLLIARDVDHVSAFATKGLPYGVGCAAFRGAVLEKAAEAAVLPYDREHVEPFMIGAESVRKLAFPVPSPLNRPEILVSVDTAADFDRVHRAAQALLKKHGIHFTTKQLIEWFDDVPVLAVANGQVGLECVKYLKQRGEKICGLVLHPDGSGKHQDEIREAAGVTNADVLVPRTLKDAHGINWVLDRKPELVTCFWSRFIIPAALVNGVPRGITNLHNSMLPLARGGEANIWTIVDRHPAGVSLHYINESIDEGPLIAQHEVETTSWDTGEALYDRLEAALIQLFIDEWPRVRVGPVAVTPQSGEASYHKYRASEAIRQIDLNASFTGREMIDRLRALTFPPYRGAYFIDDAGNRVDIKLVLEKYVP